jgi:GNAT superfamily N-acetyltransferase
MIVKSLENIHFEVIMKCFLEAFDNYFVAMPTDYEYYRTRWEIAKVDYKLSYGMFDNDKLVGFIINAIDQKETHKIAFNTGTGVIPSYRGKRIVKSIYEYAIPDLINHGITKCALEVITENNAAIKSYESIGFKIKRTLKCFGGTLEVEPLEFKLKEASFKEIDWDALPNQKLYSWDNQKECLERGEYTYFQVYNQGVLESFFAIKTDTGYVAQLEVFNNNQESWSCLLNAIKSISSAIKINNIDDRLIDKLNAIEKAGLKNTVNQYQMEFLL